MSNFTYFNTLILCVWLQVINVAKFIHQGEGYIKVKIKYLHPFNFYVAFTLCKWVVCIWLDAFLLPQKFGLVVGTLLVLSHSMDNLFELFTLRGGGDTIISSLCSSCLTPFVLFMILMPIMLLALRGDRDTSLTRSIFRAASLGFGRTWNKANS